MESLFFLIPVALVFCAIAIRLLLWAIDSGQYDDLDKESWRILNDDEAGPHAPESAAADQSVDASDRERSQQPGGAGNEKPRSGDAA
jgi:cbb3-type cytochrome oxidase maturation protein